MGQHFDKMVTPLGDINLGVPHLNVYRYSVILSNVESPLLMSPHPFLCPQIILVTTKIVDSKFLIFKIFGESEILIFKKFVVSEILISKIFGESKNLSTG